MVRDHQLATREGQAGPCGVAERLVVVMKRGNARGAKGPQFKVNATRGESQEIGVNLQTPEKVRKLQTALHAKAKGSPDYRFYALYDKVYREDILAFAYRCCQANGGAAGVDDQTFEDIESYGLERWLGELAEAYRAIDMHARRRLRQWLCRKHRVRDAGVSRYSLEYLHGELGLARLITRKRNFPWAKA